MGPITALTWALERERFLVSPRSEKPSVIVGFAVMKRAPPTSDAHTAFQTTQQTYPRVLVEAGKVAPREDHVLALVYEREKQKGMLIERRWPLLGRWWRICSPSIAGNATLYVFQIPRA
jgi:hypothetical protein